MEADRVGQRRRARRPDEAHGELRAVGGDQGAAHHVAVPADVLGGGVHHDVRAERQGLLQVRGGEGVVDHEQRASRTGVGGERGDVRDAEQRVGGRLHPDELGAARLDGVDHGAGVGQVDGRVVDAPRAEHTRDQPVGPAVGVVGHHDVVAGAQHRAQQRVLRGEPGREREARAAALGRTQRLLERRARGVRGPRVLVPAAQPSDAVLLVGGDLVDGGHHGAGGAVRVLTGVDRTGGEPCGVPVVAGVLVKGVGVGRHGDRLGGAPVRGAREHGTSPWLLHGVTVRRVTRWPDGCSVPR